MRDKNRRICTDQREYEKIIRMKRKWKVEEDEEERKKKEENRLDNTRTEEKQEG